MTDLITRLSTEPPSRELNDEVLKAHGWYQAMHSDFDAIAPVAWFRPNGICWGITPGPTPLTNLQDAADLVPEGWFWQVGRTSAFSAWANVYKHHPDHCEEGKTEFHFSVPYYESDNFNPATALTIAALKARGVSKP